MPRVNISIKLEQYSCSLNKKYVIDGKYNNVESPERKKLAFLLYKTILSLIASR